jgi:hypothetical protein
MHCAQLCDACADHCDMTIETMQTGSNADCATCARVCDDCAAECEKHNYRFTNGCSLVCRQSADACRTSANTPVRA